MNHLYIFKSERLGFRNWMESDIQKMAAINNDPVVMEFFPGLRNAQQTREFVERMQKQYAEKGYCYFAVDRLDTGGFIGFIGISEQNFQSDFTPCTDIGWRLARKEWGNGFATEGAKACLQYAFANTAITNIVSICPVINTKSEAVMEKIGMHKQRTFSHPLLLDNERLKTCVLYNIQKDIK